MKCDTPRAFGGWARVYTRAVYFYEALYSISRSRIVQLHNKMRLISHMNLGQIDI